MPAFQAQFETARAIALQLLTGARTFAIENDGGIDSALLTQLDTLAREILDLTCDPKSLRAYPVPFPDRQTEMYGTPLGFTDARIDSMLEKAFPPGHAFHSLTRRRMLQELGNVRQVTEALRKNLFHQDNS